MNYKKKYLKYKNKYLDLKNSIQIGGNNKYSCKSVEQFKINENITIHDFCYKDPKGKYDNLVDCAWSNECLERYFSRKNPRLREKKDDIEEVNCRNGEPGCIRCKLCNSVSGTAKIIDHHFGCKYFEVPSSIFKVLDSNFEVPSSIFKVLDSNFECSRLISEPKTIESYTPKSNPSEIIDILINRTESQRLKEKPSDIEDAKCIDSTLRCIRCKLCKSVSGIDKIIDHHFGCKYNEEIISSPIILGDRKESDIFMDSSISFAVLQREYGIVDTTTFKKIIYSYGAGPCVILCMHDTKTQRAILAHIDSNTLDPLDNYRSFPKDSDVYIIGGDNSSIKNVNMILKILNNRGYKIKFAHIIDKKPNSFAINCITGDTYLDDSVIVLPNSPDELQRISIFSMFCKFDGKLKLIKTE